jgi:catechol 2,3-dioxygenase-like lactoylglutathione lyase family enzyme
MLTFGVVVLGVTDRARAEEFWCAALGYRPVRTGQFEESYPELAPLLATPCDLVIYHKVLPASP